MKLKVKSSPYSHIVKGMVGETKLTPEEFAAKNGGALIEVQFFGVRNPTYSHLKELYDPVVCLTKKELEVANE